ncbi:hypothetical protein ACH5RR_012358 [Cinchona calisaya]|uniref:Uncharacterized protein n=1 Tax=Cinchona calisaya TaxID=153742 RepID=A0ABD3A927_9GENT
MSVSIEALAMAGVNYNEYPIDFEEMEKSDLPPPHLLAEVDDQEEEQKMVQICRPQAILALLFNILHRQGFQIREDKSQLLDGRDEDVNYGKKPSSYKIEIPFVIYFVVAFGKLWNVECGGYPH